MRTIVVIIALSLMSGCASITGTTIQSVSIRTVDKAGTEVQAAACEMTNSKGKWFITSPGSASITRSNDDLQVLCTKTGIEPGRAFVVSGTKGMMFGNILFGGGIGAIVDHNSGAAYEYPSFFQIIMGASSKIEPPAQPNDTSAEVPASALTPSNVGGSKDQIPFEKTKAGQPAAITKETAGPSTAATKEVAGGQQLVESRLRELKRLHDAGLINAEMYQDQQRRVLEASDDRGIGTPK